MSRCCLLVFLLALVPFVLGETAAQNQPQRKRRGDEVVVYRGSTAVSTQRTLTWTVKLDPRERRTKPSDAEDEVVKKAQQVVVQWLREACPGSTFVPSTDYLRKKAVGDLRAESQQVDLDGEQVTMYVAS